MLNFICNMNISMSIYYKKKECDDRKTLAILGETLSLLKVCVCFHCPASIVLHNLDHFCEAVQNQPCSPELRCEDQQCTWVNHQ